MYDANAWVSLIFLSVILVLPGSFVLGRHSKDQGINYSAKDVAKFFLALAAIGLFLTLMWPGGWQLILIIYGSTPFLYIFGALSRKSRKKLGEKPKAKIYHFYGRLFSALGFLNRARGDSQEDEPK
jgi:fatty acid desaturase